LLPSNVRYQWLHWMVELWFAPATIWRMTRSPESARDFGYVSV